jgi:predicted ATPase/DNA-binding CsgD family transcriptional regulator
VHATRLVTLTGPGGIGKTRLALRTLTLLADGFPDGVRLIELADLNHPDLVVPRLATMLGVTEEQGRPLLDTLADAVGGSRMLLALDNCEHVIDACAQACQRLLATSPGLRIVATSREPLRVMGEAVWPVPPMAVTAPAPGTVAADAARLFTERAVAALPTFTVSAPTAEKITDLCRALDGIPLAIELAAARVPALSVDQISERLADRFALLTTGNRTAPRRQRTLRAAIDWSHDLLSEPEQVLLRRLSVFAGWSLDMAEQVCADLDPGDITAADVLDLLAALVDKSLVVREAEALGQARYRLLDTIRQYAAGRLAEAGETRIVQLRHRNWVLGVAEHDSAVGMAIIPGAWAERVNAFRRYDVDAGNLWQALNQCLADGDLETGMRLCTAVRPVWLARGEYRLGSTWLEGFLAAPGAAQLPPRMRGAALITHAQLLLSSDPVTAEPLARSGLDLARGTHDGYWEAIALATLGEIALHTGRTDEAEQLASEAMTIAQAAGHAWCEGYSLGILAAVVGRRLQLGAARDLATASIAIMRSLDHAWGAARAQLGLADLDQLQGEHDDARQGYAEALGIFRQIDARPEIARCLVGLARVAMSLGDLPRARQHLTESIQLCRRTGARIGVARGLESFAALAIQEGDPRRAVQLVAAATALREAGGLPPLPAERAERYLTPARDLGDAVVPREWAHGLERSAEAAIELAISPVASAVPSPRSGQPASPLSVREQEIAALVAGGRTNKEIGAELHISTATVARHIANIMRKLDLHTRTQIAMWITGPRVPLQARPRSGPGHALG